MKTKFFSAIIMFFFTLAIQAQTLHVGFQAGPLFSGVELFNQGTSGTGIAISGTTYSGGNGFHLTVPVEFKFNRFLSVQPEFSYQRFEYHENIRQAFDNSNLTMLETNNRHRLNFIHGNLIAKISTGGEKFGLYVLGGPNIGSVTSGNTEREELAFYKDGGSETSRGAKSYEIEDSPFNSKYRGWIYGGGISVGLPYYSVNIEARKYTSTTSLLSEDNLRVNGWSLNLGVSFPIIK